MTVYKSEKSNILVGNESSQNSKVTPTRQPGKIDEDTELPDPEKEFQEKRYIGDGRTLSEKVEGQKAYDGGSLPIMLYDGFPIAWLLGKDNFDGTDTHEISPKEDGLPSSVTLEASLESHGNISNDFVRTFGGVIPQSGTISLDNESSLVCELDLVAMDVETGTSLTSGSVSNREVFTFEDVTSNLNIFGNGFAEVEDFEIEIENNLQVKRYLEDANDDGSPSLILYGGCDISMSATIDVTDKAIYDELNNPTDGGFTATIELGKDSNSDSIKFDLSSCNFTSAPVSIAADPEAEQYEVEMTAEDITVTVVDNTASSAYI